MIIPLVIGLTIGLFISIVHAIRYYIAIRYVNKIVGLRLKTGKPFPLDHNRMTALHHLVFNIVGFPVLCSLLFFVVALIVMSFIN